MEEIYKWLTEIVNKYPPFDPIDWIPKRILEDRAKGIADNYKTLRELETAKQCLDMRNDGKDP